MEDINLIDIAHSLSLMTRGNGHFEHFYSVAQHCISCFREAKNRGYSEKVQLACLLHDASESYLSDITRPVKRNLPEYFVLEEKLQKVIYERFELGDISNEECQQILDVDDTLLHLEFEDLMNVPIYDSPRTSAMKHDFSEKEFKRVEKEFISIYHRLTNKGENFSSIGIDGCKGGWVAVSITGESFEVNIFKSIDEISAVYADFERVIIDMPIGLPESVQDLRPDAAARKLLKRKASSIFNTPCRQAVYASSYSEANQINREILGKGLSRQSFAISDKIKEIDEFLRKNPASKNKLLESHPELCFAILNSGEPIYENKKTDEGKRKRIELLSRFYPEALEVLHYASEHSKYKSILDDIIDALCLAVMGRISLQKELTSLPENPMMDKEGILMQLVYAKSD